MGGNTNIIEEPRIPPNSNSDGDHDDDEGKRVDGLVEVHDGRDLCQ